ncbi:MAG TPA: hypothetical protein ENG03_07880 [Thioploca sp.]|nr:hypothetical protein [Thioploca sp.]
MNDTVRIGIFGSRAVGKTTHLGSLWRYFGPYSSKENQTLRLSADSDETKDYLDKLASFVAQGATPPTDKSVPLKLSIQSNGLKPMRVETFDVPGEWLELGYKEQLEGAGYETRQQLSDILNRSDAILFFLEPAHFAHSIIQHRLEAKRDELRAFTQAYQTEALQTVQSLRNGEQFNGFTLSKEAIKECQLIAEQLPESQATEQMLYLVWDELMMAWLTDVTQVEWRGIVFHHAHDNDKERRIQITTPTGRRIGFFGNLLDSSEQLKQFERWLQGLLACWSVGPFMAATARVLEMIEEGHRLIVAFVVLKSDQLPGYTERHEQFIRLIPPHLEHIKLLQGGKRLQYFFSTLRQHYAGDQQWRDVLIDLDTRQFHSLLLRVIDQTLDYQMFFVSALEQGGQPLGIEQPWQWCAEQTHTIRSARLFYRWHRIITGFSLTALAMLGLFAALKFLSIL